jgi:protocatechuate 3,4-dioxygenase beta subunit
MRHLVLILLIPLALSAQGRGAAGGGQTGSPNTPPPPPPTPTADLATVEGTVSNALGGTPLRKASIHLNRMNNGPNSPARGNYSGSTDASGHYSITGVEPGTYRISVDHTGYLSMQYNARRPGGPGTPLDVGRAQKMTGVDFRLTPHGVVSGKVTDEDGDPIEGVQLQLLRLAYNQGKPQLQVNGGSNTNDLGEYRMSGIQPGKYYLCAIYRGRGMMMPDDSLDANKPQEDFVTTYFGGANDIAAASPFEMGPGDQMSGMNIRLTKTHTVQVSGRVFDNSSPAAPVAPDGRGVAGANGAITAPLMNNRIQLWLQPRSALNPNGQMVNTRVRADGGFTFPSVAPGPYYLIASSNNGGGRGGHSVRQAIDVGSNNVEGLNLSINPGAEVTGQVRYDGDPPSPLPSLSVRLSLRDPNMAGFGGPGPQAGKVDPDGSFHFEDVNPDQYNVDITNLPQGLYVKSIQAGNVDALVAGLDLTSSNAPVDILLGTNPPQVSGSVAIADTGQPAIAVTVILIPREKERQDQTYFYGSTTTDQYGNFTFSRVTPGDYTAYAFEDVQRGQWFDPEFMKPYEGKGETLTAKESSPVTVKLNMIPAK